MTETEVELAETPVKVKILLPHTEGDSNALDESCTKHCHTDPRRDKTTNNTKTCY